MLCYRLTSRWFILGEILGKYTFWLTLSAKLNNNFVGKETIHFDPNIWSDKIYSHQNVVIGKALIILLYIVLFVFYFEHFDTYDFSTF